MDHPPHTTAAELELAGSADLVYDFLTDAAFVGRWHPGVRGMEGRGDQLVERRRLLPIVPITVSFPLEVVERLRGEHYAVRAELAAGTMRIEGRYELAPAGDGPADGTRVRIAYRVTALRFGARPVAAIIRRVLALEGRAQARAMPDGFEMWLAARA